jgi:SAM-dependent methyltransferase
MSSTITTTTANKATNKATWEEADFCTIAEYMRQSGEDVVHSIGVNSSMRVLDLGCGDGTTALPLAECGAEVVGIDIASNLIAAGKRRAAEAGLDRLQFQEGDASNLEGVDDNTFDLTLTMFGAMFAPRPFDVAREMVRVTRPGGRIVMGNWIPEDPSFISQMRKISASLLPPPPAGTISTLTWGLETHIFERFCQVGVSPDRISLVKDTYAFTAPDKTPEDFVETFTRFYEPTFEAAQVGEKLSEFQERLLKLAKAQNRSTDGSTFIPANFLRVTVSL